MGIQEKKAGRGGGARVAEERRICRQKEREDKRERGERATHKRKSCLNGRVEKREVE